jgi:two-component system, chemotaxis family, chemotaxis protein CheY
VALGEVYQADSGAQGLQALDDHWIDLALIDINMPVMDGEEMLDRVRQNPVTASLAILVISTEGSETRIARLRQKGAEFLHKPFLPEALREMILQITGVTDGQPYGDGALSGSDFDF